MEDQWTRYLCKSGQTLFIYNKTTGEHRWPSQNNSETMSNNIKNGEPMLYKKLCSVATQTDDTGCINGCTSLLAKAGCVSARASVVEVRMDGLDVSEQSVNNSGSIISNPGTRVINSTSLNSKGPQNRLLLPKPIMNGHVDTASRGATAMEVQMNPSLRNEQYSNNVITTKSRRPANGSSPSNQSIIVGSSGANNIVSSFPNSIPVQSIVQPGNQGYISGALYLGHGKFANVLLPANNPTSPMVNGHVVIPSVISSPLSHTDSTQRQLEIGMVQNSENVTSPASSIVPSSQAAGRRSQETTVVREKYLVNGMIANVQHGAKVVNSNLTKVFHSKTSSTTPSSASVSKSAANENKTPSSTASSSKSADTNLLISVNNKNTNKTSPSSSHGRKSREPKQFVISNVFSYATGDVINPENQESNKDEGLETNTSSELARVESELLEGETSQEIPAGTVKVKEEPGLEDSNDHDITNNIHKCTYCSKTFANSNSLLVHQRTHTGEKPFKCPHCDKEFRHNSSLKVHVKLHTGEKPYKCCSCDRTFRQKVHLRNHLRTHTEDNKFKCSYCDRGFRHKGNLVSHLLTHSAERPYRCQVCDRTFSQKAHLESHEQSHCKRKQDICPYCNKEFKFGSSLTLHMRTHTGEKPFKCSLCDMTFRQKQHLIVHVRRHTGEKPFKCVHCNKAFRHDTALRSHLLIHPESKYSQAQAAMFTAEQRMGNVE